VNEGLLKIEGFSVYVGGAIGEEDERDPDLLLAKLLPSRITKTLATIASVLAAR